MGTSPSVSALSQCLLIYVIELYCLLVDKVEDATLLNTAQCAQLKFYKLLNYISEINWMTD